MGKEPSENYSKTFRKGLRILDLFNQDHSGLRLKDISEKLDLDMMTAYRLVNTLVLEGYLGKDPDTKLLKLGSKAISLGYRAINTLELFRISTIRSRSCGVETDPSTSEMSYGPSDVALVASRK